MKNGKKVVVIMPAYNAEKTLEKTYNDIPKEYVDDVLVVDDCSTDKTVEVAKKLNLKTIVHRRNKGYGGNQKTCYNHALKMGADIVVMVHPDHQYDPKIIPELIQPLIEDKCDAVFGSRMLGRTPLEGGMPLWKFRGNLLLTAIANSIFCTYLTEYHSGFRAYTKKYLTSVKYNKNSDDFVFDTEIIAQGIMKNLKFQEIPIATKYFKDASSIGKIKSLKYGLSIFFVLVKYILHKNKIIKSKLF